MIDIMMKCEASEEATEKKAYCDEMMAKTNSKKVSFQDDAAMLTTNQDTAKSAQLKKAIRLLEAELAAVTKEQADMDKIHMGLHEDYVVAKLGSELGLAGVRGGLLAQLSRLYRPCYTV